MTGAERDADKTPDQTALPPDPNEKLHLVCPGPGCTPVKGADVYRAEAHPITCTWMMRVARRCHIHDELLRPDEVGCPHPDVIEDWFDPHNRTGTR